MEPNSFEKFKAIAPLPILHPYFRFFFSNKNFSENPVNPDMVGDLILITSTVKVELSKFNFNFDDIRTNFLQVFTY